MKKLNGLVLGVSRNASKEYGLVKQASSKSHKNLHTTRSTAEHHYFSTLDSSRQ